MACNYRTENLCRITNNICPWVFYCGKINSYKERDNAINYCKYREQAEIPKGTYVVEFEKKGYLYVNIGDETIKIENPFDYIPEYVKLYKAKDSWKIKKEKEKKE